ncbi:MAG: alanine racemase, partial [Pirellulaceae bacterium]|nr:alanine racemase [Pirellulaceae bacterium]
MAKHASSHGKQLRPHAKTHKCVEVVRRQQALGAVGVCVATVSEAEVMAAGDIAGILLASPIATPSKFERMASLAAGGRNVTVAVDHPQQVAMYAQAAAKVGSKLGVLIDLDVGDHRTGIEPGEPALKLGEIVTKSKQLELRGLQAYSGGSSHVVGFAQRRDHSHQAMSKAAATR